MLLVRRRGNLHVVGSLFCFDYASTVLEGTLLVNVRCLGYFQGKYLYNS